MPDKVQPPSGGCVLKLFLNFNLWRIKKQPPSGGCVLKRAMGGKYNRLKKQPPSGGCVLKPLNLGLSLTHHRSHLRVAVC